MEELHHNIISISTDMSAVVVHNLSTHSNVHTVCKAARYEPWADLQLFFLISKHTRSPEVNC